jgi:hypothetical protein
MIIYYAQGTSRNFIFEAIGKDKTSAKEKLMGALRKHGSQYELPKDWHKEEVEINIRPLDSRTFYRDGDLF